MENRTYDSFADKYDFLMRDISYEEWSDYLCSFLDESDKEIKKICDIGCGTGSITVLLSERGYSLTGIDQSVGMLEIASEKARSSGQRIMFSNQDLKELVLGRTDVVVMNMDVINYIAPEDLQMSFERISGGLKKGGLMLFDISSGYKIRNILGNNFFYEDYDDVTYFWKNTLSDDEKSVDMELTFFIRDGEGYKRRDEFQTQYAHEADDVKKTLEKAGFSVDIYAFGTRDKVKEDTERIFFRCRKDK